MSTVPLMLLPLLFGNIRPDTNPANDSNVNASHHSHTSHVTRHLDMQITWNPIPTRALRFLPGVQRCQRASAKEMKGVYGLKLCGVAI
jgi:hypothetical protein